MPEIFVHTGVYEHGLAFRQERLENYYIDYIEAPRKTHLIIVFDGSNPDLDIPAAQRLPWGARFFNAEGFAMIGVKVVKPDWYRGADLHHFFQSAPFQKFIKQYENICLYGNSMGGYAALAFAGAIKGARVLALGPQTTLDPRLVPWDDRFPEGTAQNWDGAFADAAETLEDVAAAYVVYDPFYLPDNAHIKRLPQDKLIHLKTPFLQHDLAPQLLDMDLLGPLFLHFIEGDLESWFPQNIRARKNSERYEYNALLLWALRLYERGAGEAARQALHKLIEKNPGSEYLNGILRAMNAGKPINRKWQALRRKNPPIAA